MLEPLGMHDTKDGEREFFVMPMRYDAMHDELVPVTQEWVDSVQRQFLRFGQARAAAKKAIGIQDDIVVSTHPALQAFLDAWRPEFEQKPEQS